MWNFETKTSIEQRVTYFLAKVSNVISLSLVNCAKISLTVLSVLCILLELNHHITESNFQPMHMGNQFFWQTQYFNNIHILESALIFEKRLRHLCTSALFLSLDGCQLKVETQPTENLQIVTFSTW